MQRMPAETIRGCEGVNQFSQPVATKPFDILHGVNPVDCPLCGKPTKVELQFCAKRGKYVPRLNHYSLGAHLIGSTRITGEFPAYWHCAHCLSQNGFTVFAGTVYLHQGYIKSYSLTEPKKTYYFNGRDVFSEKDGEPHA